MITFILIYCIGILITAIFLACLDIKGHPIALAFWFVLWTVLFLKVIKVMK